MRELKSLRDSLDRLNILEQQLDAKDQELAEVQKKSAVQEEAIASWVDVVGKKDQELAAKDEEKAVLAKEIVDLKEKINILKKDHGD